MKAFATKTWLGVVASVAAATGCGADVDYEDPSVAEAQQEIIGGTAATAYPESALVNLYKSKVLKAACSGSLIAPKVILTAGHCVVGFDEWHLTLPHASNQVATSTSAAVYDWKSDGTDNVNPKLHDVALVFLPSALKLTTFPVLSRQALATTAKVVNLGRIKSGVFSSTSLFVSAAMPLKLGSLVGYSYDYYATDFIEPGDSGGPDIVVGTTPHQIAAVNSGAGSGVEVLARVDLVATWIDAQVAAHGGYSK